MDRDRLSEEELAERAGTTIERVRRLVGLGLLEPEVGAFRRRDVMRVRVVQELEAKGMDANALASAVASGHLKLGYLESAGRRFPRSDRTFAEFSKELGVPLETLQTLYVAFGLPRPREDENVREEDAPILITSRPLRGRRARGGRAARGAHLGGQR